MSSKVIKSAFVGWTFSAGIYYPPDFDSTLLTPLKNLRPKGQQKVMNIRMMFPFTMICDACGEYNYTGTKFTAKVEDIKHEAYLGIKVYRFYGRCRHCWAEFTFKTDPKNSDYTMESGGKRTYEAWKDADMVEAQLKAEKEQEAAQDQMKALEQKSVDVQAEMQRLEDLDAIRTMNKRLGSRDKTIEEALGFLFEKAQKEEEMSKKALGYGEMTELEAFREAQESHKRKALDDALEEEDDHSTLSGNTATSSSSSAPTQAAGSAISGAVAERLKEQQGVRKGAAALLSVKKKAPAAPAAAAEAPAEKKQKTEAPAEEAPTGGLGLGGYDSDSS